MPKKTFDVFVPLSRTDWLYRQLKRKQRKRGIEVRGTTKDPEGGVSLSTHMIDPKYLDVKTGSTRTGQPVTHKRGAGLIRYSDLELPHSTATATVADGPSFWSQFTDKLGRIRMWPVFSHKSKVTYTLTQGVVKNAWTRSRRWAAVSIGSMALLLGLTLAIANWPNEREVLPPNQPTPAVTGSDSNDSRPDETKQPANDTASSSSTVSPVPVDPAAGGSGGTQPVTSSRSTDSASTDGGRGGGGNGGLTEPVEEVIEDTCVTTLLECMNLSDAADTGL